jgi:protein-tyrosine phosphatase
MAQTVLQDRLEAAGLAATVDSAAVSDEEWGNPIDPRARRVLEQAGYTVPDHKARRIDPDDFADYDLIIVMTFRHHLILRHLAERVGAGDPPLRMLRQFDHPDIETEPSPEFDIDDPWYGDLSDFERTLAQIEAAAPGVLTWVERQLGTNNPDHGNGAG